MTITLILFCLSAFFFYLQNSVITDIRFWLSTKISSWFDYNIFAYYVTKLLECEICSSFWFMIFTVLVYPYLPQILITSTIIACIASVCIILKNMLSKNNDF